MVSREFETESQSTVAYFPGTRSCKCRHLLDWKLVSTNLLGKAALPGTYTLRSLGKRSRLCIYEARVCGGLVNTSLRCTQWAYSGWPEPCRLLCSACSFPPSKICLEEFRLYDGTP